MPARAKPKPVAPSLGEEQTFAAALRADWRDDTARLVYADWLDEQGRSVTKGGVTAYPAARLRWWVGARQALRAGVVWDRPTEGS